jgi:hypothetical protein
MRLSEPHRQSARRAQIVTSRKGQFRSWLSWPGLARFCELSAVAAVLITVTISLVAVVISQW